MGPIVIHDCMRARFKPPSELTIFCVFNNSKIYGKVLTSKPQVVSTAVGSKAVDLVLLIYY